MIAYFGVLLIYVHCNGGCALIGLNCIMKTLKTLLIFIITAGSISVYAQTAPKPTQPEYPGGLPAIELFLRQQLMYPEQAHKQGVEGRVVVGFMINEQGRVVSPKIVKSIHPALDSEAVRVVQLMPRWKPGMKDKTPIVAPVVLPIVFELTGKAAK